MLLLHYCMCFKVVSGFHTWVRIPCWVQLPHRQKQLQSHPPHSVPGKSPVGGSRRASQPTPIVGSPSTGARPPALGNPSPPATRVDTELERSISTDNWFRHGLPALSVWLMSKWDVPPSLFRLSLFPKRITESCGCYPLGTDSPGTFLSQGHLRSTTVGSQRLLQALKETKVHTINSCWLSWHMNLAVISFSCIITSPILNWGGWTRYNLQTTQAFIHSSLNVAL